MTYSVNFANYTIGTKAYENVNEVCHHYGTKALLIGGKALDTAKGTAEKAGLPVFTFPTIAVTCAATTALSVVYKEKNRLTN